jgi:hypothetical protein
MTPRLRKCDESMIAGRLAKAEQFLLVASWTLIGDCARDIGYLGTSVPPTIPRRLRKGSAKGLAAASDGPICSGGNTRAPGPSSGEQIQALLHCF